MFNIVLCTRQTTQRKNNHILLQQRKKTVCVHITILSFLFLNMKFMQMEHSSFAISKPFLDAAVSEAWSSLASKLYVSLPSLCWLQHRLDSRYTCSSKDWDPVSGDWPMSMYALLNILFSDTYRAHIVSPVDYTIVTAATTPSISTWIENWQILSVNSSTFLYRAAICRLPQNSKSSNAGLNRIWTRIF